MWEKGGGVGMVGERTGRGRVGDEALVRGGINCLVSVAGCPGGRILPILRSSDWGIGKKRSCH